MSDDRDDQTPGAAITTAPVAGGGGTRSAFANASWNAVATLWGIAVAFVVTKLLILRLGADHFGLLLLVWSVTGLLGIANLGLGEATLRYVALYHGRGDVAGVNRVFRSTLAFYLVMCAAVSVVLLVASPAIAGWLNLAAGQRETAIRLLRLVGPVFSFGILARAFGAIPMALNRYDVSGKVGIAESVIRSLGYVAIVTAGFGLLQLVVWDLVTQLALLTVNVVLARRMLPGLRPLRQASFGGLREVLGYSVFSFMTYVFHAMYRESGKLALGASVGTTSVAHFGTPDSVAYRAYMVVANGGESLLSRFSTERDAGVAARPLVLSATWASVAASVVLFVPLAVLMPALLSLWINPDFSRRSGAVGQLVALGYLAPAAFGPLATFFRGTGRPWVVTVVMAAAGLVTSAACIALIPRYGVAGAGVAYVLSAAPWLAGLGCGWAYAFGRRSVATLARAVVVPFALACTAFATGTAVRDLFGATTWLAVFALGATLVGCTALLVFGVDLALGGDAPSRKLLLRIAESDKVQAVRRRLSAWRVPGDPITRSPDL